MTGSLQHRGPDDAGVWADYEAGVAFGHSRLSIIDLSAAGHQPMVSHDGRYVITFNGEVYGYAGLRAALQARGVSFIGHSNTEVLVESIASPGCLPSVFGTARNAVPSLRRHRRPTAWSNSPGDFRVAQDCAMAPASGCCVRFCVPATLIERPKMGFATPLAEWLRGPLRDWTKTLLDERRLRETGLVNSAAVRALWKQHLDGRRNHHHLLWDILMLEAWHTRWHAPAIKAA